VDVSAVVERRLYLLRHAKSSWKDEGLADHDRPLARRGRRASKAIGRHLREQGVEPELVLCSTARRARETLEGLAPSFGRVAIRLEPELYGAGPDELLARLHEIAPPIRSAMVIGHNPGLEQLALLLARRGSTVRELETKFPTGALATLAFRGHGWAALDRGTAELLEFIRPRDLE
jgi:phosphohistidine phosphatase